MRRCRRKRGLALRRRTRRVRKLPASQRLPPQRVPRHGKPPLLPFAEATRGPVRRGGGNALARGPLFGLFPEGLPSATWWVARAGVVLLLVGVSFLLRMGVEQGWLTPAVRVAGGVAIGGALSAFGLLARTSRPAYSQLLVGGGVVAFYLSAFGAWSVWQLVPYEAAFVFCVLTTAFAFAAAVRLNAQWLALLGVMGGYATPFMLLSPDSNVPALVAYSLLLLGGYLMVYVLRGWRPVYGTAIFGIWTILAVSDLGSAHLHHLYRGRTAHRRRVVGVHGGAHRLAHDTLPHQRPPLSASGRQGECLFGDRGKR